jgi:hypothetical protein
MGNRGGACRVLVGRPEGKRSTGKFSRRWEDNIKINFKAIGWKGVDWFDLAHDMDRWRALVNAVMNLRFP